MACSNRGTCKSNCKKYCSIVGAHMIMAPMSFFWVYGNLSEYLESYFRFACAPECMDGNTDWLIGLCFAMVCPGIFASNYVVDKIGLKRTGIATSIVLNAVMLGSAWTVQRSIAWTVVLLGVLLGLVRGVSPIVAFQYVAAWAPENSQFFISTVSSAGAIISMVQNQIVTLIVNPRNLQPDVIQGPKAYFSQKEVLDRVPAALMTFAAINAGFQIVGYLLLSRPPNFDILPKNSRPAIASSTEVHCKPCDRNGSIGTDTDIPKSINSPDYVDYGSTIGEGTATISNKNQQTVTNGNSNSPIATDSENSTKALHTDIPKRSLKPSEVLRTPVFYAVFLYGLAIVFALALKANYYKEFGLLYIPNDNFLTLVGTLNPILAAVSRTMSGILISKGIINLKDLILFSIAVATVLCSFWFFAPQINAVLYLVFIVTLSASTSIYLFVLPTASLQLFGPDHFSSNYALLMTNIFVMGMLEPVLVRPLMHSLGWQWLFASASILCAIALVTVTCADFKVT